MRTGRTSTMRALVCAPSVMIPLCDPVKLTASTPQACSAIPRSAIEIRSPAVRSMSSSRRCGSSVTLRARASSSSVVSPIAETTTTTCLPPARACATRAATPRIFSTSATEEPPYFWTMIATPAVCRPRAGGRKPVRHPPPAGSGRVAGFDVLEQPMEVKRRTGYLPETPPVYTDMTVRAYLRFVAEIKGVPRKERESEVERVATKTNSEKFIHRVIGNLSKGQRQRGGLAQTLLADHADPNHV